MHLPGVEERLRRIEELEPRLHAFAWLDDLDDIRAAAADPRPGALSGRLIGVKDVVDTAGIPTECGTPLLRGRIPERSASVVDRIQAAGGILAGKTVTAELAYFTPGPTLNPWDPTRTPGGSSMGSAAAVAAGMVDAAVGTQTNGSVIRPAAFCGCAGYKPSFGIIPRDGILTFSESLDTVGSFGATVADAARLAGVMANRDLRPKPAVRPRMGVAMTPEWQECAPDLPGRFEEWLRLLEAFGGTVERTPLPESLAVAMPVHHVIMAFEAHRNLGPLVDRDPELISRRLRDLLEAGAGIGEDRYREAIAARDRAAEEFARWAAPYDAVLTLPTLGEAPSTETTGDPRMCTRWTLIGAPAVSVPAGRGAHNLPLGLQLVGAQATDVAVLGCAAWAEAALREELPAAEE